jgi:hypothetical protein
VLPLVAGSRCARLIGRLFAFTADAVEDGKTWLNQMPAKLPFSEGF